MAIGDNTSIISNVTARGGYQILDFSGVIFTPGTMVGVQGIYSYLKDMLPLKKPILLCNISISDNGSIETLVPQYVIIYDAPNTNPPSIRIILEYGQSNLTIFSNDNVLFTFAE